MAPHAESPQRSQSPNAASSSADGGSLFANGFRGAGGNQRSGPDDRPNILYVMADQMSAPLLKMHDPNSPIKTPNIDKLAAEGTVFDSAYCNSPLCAPSRFCMISGQLPSKIAGYDNASTFSSEIPTYAHYLRREGYETVLAGKMHFIGPDQLHGFENRLTSDIYPADFGWSVNWEEPELRQEWYHNMSSVLQAGPAARTNQLDYDEEVMYKSVQWLYDYARQPESRRPFCLTVSMTHPHDPYATTKDLWDLYEDTEIPMPSVTVDQSEQDPHSARILKAIEAWDQTMDPEAIKRARRAYFGSCSYIDQNIGKLRKVLKDCGLSDNTIIIFGGDHGDMLGERNLWYKMSWFENSARVPFVFHYPPLFEAGRRIKESVSTMDLLPTLLDLIGGKLDTSLPIDGRSLYPALTGGKPIDEVFGEYMGEGTISPVVMIRRGQYKYVCSLVDPPQLFDLKNDPKEINNLTKSTDPEHVKVYAAFTAEAAQKWDLARIHDEVVRSQRQRRLCWNALSQGFFTAWDYQPRDDHTMKYIRSTIPLDDLERKGRYPAVDPFGRVKKAVKFVPPTPAAPPATAIAQQ